MVVGGKPKWVADCLGIVCTHRTGTPEAITITPRQYPHQKSTSNFLVAVVSFFFKKRIVSTSFIDHILGAQCGLRDA
jgi:hypothetical protein